MIRIVLSGYEQIRADGKNVLAATPLAADIRSILTTGTLYEHASRTAGALALSGRAPVYVVPMGSHGWRVAVRHVMRGGLFGRFIRDKFFPPTRALRELVTSIRLRMAGIPTPEVLAIATYPGGWPFRTADIITRYIEGSADLAAVYGDPRNDPHRGPILDAVARLLSQLNSVGAHHPDLNLKNILISPSDEGYVASILDVDRVNFHVPDDPHVVSANLSRLGKSMLKWRAHAGARGSAMPEKDVALLQSATAMYDSQRKAARESSDAAMSAADTPPDAT